MIRLLIVSLLVCTGPARGSTALWTDFIYTLQKTERVEWTITPTFHSRQGGTNGSYEGRIATDVQFALQDRLWLVGRYAETNRANGSGGRDWQTQVRGGVRYGLFSFSQGTLYGMARVQRNFTTEARAGSTVYRQDFELRDDRKGVRPWLEEELFFKNDGFYRTRSRLGTIITLREGRQLSLAYQFQSTQSSGAWQPLHAVVVRFWFGRHFSWRGR